MRESKSLAAGVLLGIGLGGLLEGILLRELLQWHQMLSATVPPESVDALRVNLRAGGWFELAAWALTLAGMFVLWSAIRGPGPLPSTRNFVGHLLVGWGAYNLVEGAIHHFVLEWHHVRDLPAYSSVYDWVFMLGGGLGFVLVGLALQQGRRTYPGERRSGSDRRLSYY